MPEALAFAPSEGANRAEATPPAGALVFTPTAGAVAPACRWHCPRSDRGGSGWEATAYPTPPDALQTLRTARGRKRYGGYPRLPGAHTPTIRLWTRAVRVLVQQAGGTKARPLSVMSRQNLSHGGALLGHPEATP